MAGQLSMLEGAGADAILNRVSGLADELRLASLKPQILACRKQLNGHHGLDVAVFGRFKAGKSSFLNHLTGREVLPIGVVPLTAVITRLRYGAVEEAEVHFLNGTTKLIRLEEIGLYVGEDSNPDNEKQVASVEVELPELREYEPLTFVDTPGLGSAFTHNTQVALDWLPNVGAALVAVSCDAPLSERDLALIEELRAHTPKIVLLLTKADLLTPGQRSEVLNFVHRQVNRKWGTDLPVHFYSVRPEQRALAKEFEQALLAPLIRSHDDAADQIARHKLESLIERLLNYLGVALAVATEAESARQQLQTSLAEERRQLDILRAELNVLAREWSANALDWFLAQLRQKQGEIQANITTELLRQFSKWRMRLPALLDAWREWMVAFLTRQLSGVSVAQKEMFLTPLNRARAHLYRTLQAFHGRLARHVKEALGAVLVPPEFTLEVPEPSAPPVDVSYVFDAALSTVSYLIPLTLFGKPIERVMLRKARYEVEKNISRLAADWRDRVAVTIGELVRQAEKQALDELGSLEQLAASHASKAPELNEAIQQVKGFKESLNARAILTDTPQRLLPARSNKNGPTDDSRP